MESHGWPNGEKTRGPAGGLSLTHHNAVLCIIFSWSGLNDADCFWRANSPEFAYESLDRFVSVTVPVLRDQVLPARHRDSATIQCLFDHLPVRLAGTARVCTQPGTRPIGRLGFPIPRSVVTSLAGLK